MPAVVVALVLIVNVEGSVAPASVTDVGVNEHVGRAVAPVGPVTAHVSATLPAYGVVASGTTEIIDVPVAPGEASVTLAGLPATLKVPTAATPLTTTVTGVVCDVTPVAAPVTDTV